MGWAAFGVLIACYLYDPILFVRASGVYLLIGAGYFVRAGRIPYDWRGRPPSGYLTGPAVLVVGVLLAGIGLLFLLAPHRVLPWFAGRRFSAPM